VGTDIEMFWARFEARVEAEDPRVSQLAARQLLVELLELDQHSADRELRRRLPSVGYALVRALFVEIYGEVPQGREPATDRERRLAALLGLVGQAELSRRPAQDNLMPADLHAAQRCGEADAAVMKLAPLVASGEATDAQLAGLEQALAQYRDVRATTQLSVAGERLLGPKIANALNWLARAHANRGERVQAETRFQESADEYLAAGDPTASAHSRAKVFESVQARIPDADEQLRRLAAELDALSVGTLGHVQTQVALAALALDHSDLYCAQQRIDPIVSELAALGYPVPVPEELTDTLIGWIDTVHVSDPPRSNEFLGTFAAILNLQTSLARVGLACRPAEAGRWGALLDQFVAITLQMPEHSEAAAERVGGRVGQPGGIRARSDPRSGTSADPITSGVRIMNEVTALLGVFDTGRPEAADRPELLARARRLVQAARESGARVQLSMALYVLGALLDADDRPEEAVTPMREAYELVSLMGDTGERDAAITTLSALCKLFMRLGDFAEVSVTAGTAITAIERDRYRVNAPFLQASFLTYYRDVFTAGVFSAWRLNDYDALLARTECSKARASVLRLLTRGGDAEPRRETREVDQELRELGSVIQRTEREAAQSRDSDTASSAGRDLPAELGALRERRQRLWDLRAIGTADPLARAPAVTLAALQATLEPDEGVLYHYWLSPTVLLAITLTADRIETERRILTLEQRALLEGLIAELGALTGSNLSLDDTFIAPLAEVVLPSSGRTLLEGKRRLAVSPHGLLHWFPFAAAPWDGKPMVRRFALRHIPNVTSLFIERAAPREPKVLALAVSEFPGRGRRLAALSSQAETEAVTAVYRDRSFGVDLRVEPTRADVLGLIDDGTLAEATTLVVATHGNSAGGAAPMDSTLELHDAAVDGLDILTWPLQNCELVALSACFGGQLAVRGRDHGELPGDEMFGLPAAFMEAGARSVLAPAWPADDQATTSIVIDFHRRLADGAPADLALQAAQCAYLDDPDAWTEAYFWSGLQLLSTGPLAGSRQRRNRWQS
jgi:CHAT domain-containing protein